MFEKGPFFNTSEKVMHTCDYCKAALIKRYKESAYCYARRKYCAMECQSAGRALQKRLANLSTDKETRTTARFKQLSTGRITNAILDPEMVRSIRELYNLLGFSAKEIGQLKNVKTVTIQAVLNGRTWSHIT